MSCKFISCIFMSCNFMSGIFSQPVLPCDHVRLLGIIISADLSLDRHASAVSTTSFYLLRELRRVRRSLDTESASTFVHAFVASRVDYCNLLLAGCNKAVTDKLQRVMNATARVVSGIRKYDCGMRHLRHAELQLARCGRSRSSSV